MSHTVKLAGQKLKFVYMDGPDRVRLVFEHGAIVIGTDEGSSISVGVESTSDDVAAELDISLRDGTGCYTQSEEGGGEEYKVPKPASGENKPETLTAQEKNILEQFRRGGFPFVRGSPAAPA